MGANNSEYIVLLDNDDIICYDDDLNYENEKQARELQIITPHYRSLKKQKHEKKIKKTNSIIKL